MLDNMQQFLRGLAENYRKNEIDQRELEHSLLEIIAAEIDENQLDRAVWLKAFSEAQADEPKAKALYIKFRKERLMDQVTAVSMQMQRDMVRRKQDEKKTAQATVRPKTYLEPLPELSEEEMLNRRKQDKLIIRGGCLLLFLFTVFFLLESLSA